MSAKQTKNDDDDPPIVVIINEAKTLAVDLWMIYRSHIVIGMAAFLLGLVL